MRIAFRVDATLESGIGHFMRCLTLANALKARGASTHFVCRHLPEAMRSLLESKGHGLTKLSGNSDVGDHDDLAHAYFLGTNQLHDAVETAAAFNHETQDWLVVDHYALDHRWESVLRRSAEYILVIDDLADRVHNCDLLLDQNYYRDMDTRYSGKVPPDCRVLLGPRYALLRDEFHQLRQHVGPRTGSPKRLLIFFGGVDADNFTTKAIEALAGAGVEGLRVDVVIGAQHAYRVEIDLLCKQYQYELHVQVDKIGQLMAAADLAIGAGGSATWERCCLGLPTVAFCTASNQIKQLADAAFEGLLYSPVLSGDIACAVRRHFIALSENSYLRESISSRGMLFVDGNGVVRIISKMESSGLRIRLANQSDSRQLFEWRNHPHIRLVSRNTELISWEVHQNWFSDVLTSADRLVLIGELNGIGVGAVRFDIHDASAEVSIYRSPSTGQIGLGHEFLRSAERWLAANRPDVGNVCAQVIASNDRSHRLFSGADYHVVSTTYSKGLQQSG